MPGIMVWELLYSLFKRTTMKKHFESIGGVFIMLGTVAVLAFTNADDAFLSKVSQANLAEIAAGKLAVSKGGSAEIKKLGQKMVDDHSAAQKEVVTLAKKESLTIPREPDPGHMAVNEQLSGMSGNTFDSTYLKTQLADHQATVSLFEAESASGTDPDAIAYAKKYLPKLKMHLKMFQSAGAASVKTADASAALP